MNKYGCADVNGQSGAQALVPLGLCQALTPQVQPLHHWGKSRKELSVTAALHCPAPLCMFARTTERRDKSEAWFSCAFEPSYTALAVQRRA